MVNHTRYTKKTQNGGKKGESSKIVMDAIMEILNNSDLTLRQQIQTITYLKKNNCLKSSIRDRQLSEDTEVNVILSEMCNLAIKKLKEVKPHSDFEQVTIWDKIIRRNNLGDKFLRYHLENLKEKEKLIMKLLPGIFDNYTLE